MSICIMAFCMLFEIIIFSYFTSSKCSEEFKIEAEPDISCRERNRLIGTDRNDLYELVTASLNDTIELQCHFCHEIDDMYPKIWYYQDQISNHSSQEVNIDMETNSLLNKHFVTSSHTLIIRNITVDDGGFYYCHGRTGQEMQYKYNYLVDVMYQSIISSYTGNLSSWAVYQKEVLSPMNTRLKLSVEPDLKLIREDLGVTLEIITDWGAWGKCQACGHPVGQAEKTRTGLCRIRTKRHFQEKMENDTVVAYTGQESTQENFIIHAFKLSCRSVFFNKLFPGIGNNTGNIPDYVQKDACVGSCMSEAGQKGWKSKKSQFKYKKSYVIAESAHLTLVCPESTMDSEVVWKKDNKELEGGATHSFGNEKLEPHIAVDTFSTLYILDATQNEEGNYTCTVDNFKMQEVTVIVVAKSVLLTKAFLRHMAYLAFVLSLTLSCYCAGLFVMCKRRETFKQFENLPEEEILEESEIYPETEEPGTPPSQIDLNDLLTPKLTEAENESIVKGKKKWWKKKKGKRSEVYGKPRTLGDNASINYTNLSETGTSTKTYSSSKLYTTPDFSPIESSDESIIYEDPKQKSQYSIHTEKKESIEKAELSNSTTKFPAQTSSSDITEDTIIVKGRALYDNKATDSFEYKDGNISESESSAKFLTDESEISPDKKYSSYEGKENLMKNTNITIPGEQYRYKNISPEEQYSSYDGKENLNKKTNIAIPAEKNRYKKISPAEQYSSYDGKENLNKNTNIPGEQYRYKKISSDEQYSSNDAKENLKSANVAIPEEQYLSTSSGQYSDKPEYSMRIILYQYDEEKKIADVDISNTSRSTIIQPLASDAHESSTSILQQVYTYDNDLIDSESVNKIEDSETLAESCICGFNNSPESEELVNPNLQNTLPVININYQEPSEFSECTSEFSKSNFAEDSSNAQTTDTSILFDKNETIVDYKKHKNQSRFSVLYTSLKNFFFMKTNSRSCDVVDDCNTKLLYSDNESSEDSTLYDNRTDDSNDDQKEASESDWETTEN